MPPQPLPPDVSNYRWRNFDVGAAMTMFDMIRVGPAPGRVSVYSNLPTKDCFGVSRRGVAARCNCPSA
jgi:hypothetical protein